MDSILEWLAGNPYLNLVFLLLAIASFILSIFLYFKGKRSKEPKYLTKSFSIIDDSISTIDELDIKYKSFDIKRLTITKVSFWNGGHQTIEGKDIAPADKLRITLQGAGEIISAKAILEKREATNLTCNIIKNEIHITFDFLDYGDGGIFEIYHTGSSELPPKITGTIKGAGKIAYGEYKEDFLLDSILGRLFVPLRKLKPKDGTLSEKLFLAFIVVPFGVPFVFTLTPFDKLASLFNRIPKEYDLSASNSRDKKLHKTNNT